jgi:predicted RNase H-like HicB family nuclease
MKVELVEVYSHTTNSPVIRVPERKFPGVLIQGDSLRCLLVDIEEIIECCKRGDLSEVSDGLEYLKESLADYLQVYEDVLKEHEIPLPYFK